MLPMIPIFTPSPVPLFHQLGLGVSKLQQTVVLPHPADVDQPAAVQRALGPRLIPAVELVREEVLVSRLRGSAVYRGGGGL